MVTENLKKLELKKLRDSLDKKADEVLGLNKERIKLESGMKERFSEIDIHQDLLKTQLRSWLEELQTVSSELKSRMDKVEKLKKRYDITMVSMAPPEGTPQEENSQAYYVIKAAQEKEELQREGDDLDAKIKKAEKELRALENTLEVVNSNNDTYKQSYSKAGSQSKSQSTFYDQRLIDHWLDFIQVNYFCFLKKFPKTLIEIFFKLSQFFSYEMKYFNSC